MAKISIIFGNQYNHYADSKVSFQYTILSVTKWPDIQYHTEKIDTFFYTFNKISYYKLPVVWTILQGCRFAQVFLFHFEIQCHPNAMFYSEICEIVQYFAYKRSFGSLRFITPFNNFYFGKEITHFSTKTGFSLLFLSHTEKKKMKLGMKNMCMNFNTKNKFQMILLNCNFILT